MDSSSRQTALLLYDGLCGFCNGSVQWLLKHDQADRFRFAPQQSPLAGRILLRHGMSREELIHENSVYLVLNLDSKQERLLSRSDVTVTSLLMLPGIWRLLGHLLKAVPKPIRDAGYSLVARNRFRIGGRLSSCPIPSPSQKQKFLD